MVAEGGRGQSFTPLVGQGFSEAPRSLLLCNKTPPSTHSSLLTQTDNFLTSSPKSLLSAEKKKKISSDTRRINRK